MPDTTVADKIKKDLYSSPAIEKIFPWPTEIKIYEAAGCAKCGGTGYKGRVGVYEIIFINDALEKLIGQNPSHQQILAEAKNNGFITMYQDGLMRVLNGETTLAEVERITASNV